MAKRVVTKIGDIFCAEIDGQYKRFFQYFVSDMTQLNSSVIRVFKTLYPMDYVPDLDEIVKDEVEFYAHTILRAGIDYNTWYKVGNSKELGNWENVLFRTSADIGELGFDVKNDISKKWYIWHINQPMIYVGKLSRKYYNAEVGSVMSLWIG